MIYKIYNYTIDLQNIDYNKNFKFNLYISNFLTDKLLTNQSYKLKKSLISCFSIAITLLCWKTIQVPSA